VNPAVQAKGLTLNKHDQQNYGYLRIKVDANQLNITFHPVNPKPLGSLPIDTVTVDLGKHTIV